MVELFPDGTKIDDWFYDFSKPCLDDFNYNYIITDYNIKPNTDIVYTKQIQEVIDKASITGGVIIIPKGTFVTGSLYFKDNVSLYLSKDATLKGSTSILDYNISKTRIEGETCLYYDALINVFNTNNFKLFGPGTIDGNGLHSWLSFWQRRKWNPKCTNKDEQRPRLLYISNSSNIIISDVTLKNSCFWTTHLYKSHHIKYLNCTITSPQAPVKAPSTDAIDIDYCHDILIKNCYLEVNDDSVVLKGGKGINAHNDPDNGINERIIIEDSTYGFCHGCLTCGSESIHNKNIIMRRINVKEGKNLLWLKMRPDTKQIYEHIKISDVKGKVTSFLNINPWVQFLNLDGNDILKSIASNITFQNIDMSCIIYFNVKESNKEYELANFTFNNLNINTIKNGFDLNIIKNTKINNVNINIIDIDKYKGCD